MVKKHIFANGLESSVELYNESDKAFSLSKANLKMDNQGILTLVHFSSHFAT